MIPIFPLRQLMENSCLHHTLQDTSKPSDGMQHDKILLTTDSKHQTIFITDIQ